MATDQKLEDLNLSQDEIRRLGEAFQKDEFRKLFAEYAEEISNPENRAKYEAEIREMEGERGVDIKFVNPEPGYVIKTTVDGQRKAFINICKNENIGKPTSEKKVGSNGAQGLSWSIPHSFAPPREDLAKGSVRCTVYDFVVHPDTFRMTETNTRFKKLVNDLAVDGIQRQFHVKFDAKNVKFPKMKYKGTPTPTVIRSEKKDGAKVERDPDDIMNKFPYPYENVSSAEKAKRNEEEHARKEAERKLSEQKTKRLNNDDNRSATQDESFTTPKYVVKHSCRVDMQDYVAVQTDAKTMNRPTALVVEIYLPLLRSAAPVTLDIFERRLALVSTEPARYKLDVPLPYPVNENDGTAKFDKGSRRLVITLPVLPVAGLKLPFTGESFTDEPTVEDENGNEQDFETVPDGDKKKLIEVISSVDNQSDTDAERNRRNLTQRNTMMRETEQVKHLPDFVTRQDEETLSFVFQVAKVKRELASVSVLEPSTVQVRLTSVGDGGYPVHYECTLKFDEGCRVQVDGCTLDCSAQNVVLVVTKATESVGTWNSYSVGTRQDALKPMRFETIDNIMDDLNELDESIAVDSTQDNTKKRLTKLEVTRMDVKKLSLNIKRDEEDSAENSIPDTTEIIVVHDKESPKLQGILKQRSVSESSDSIDRQVSSTYSGTASDDESEDSPDGGNNGAGGGCAEGQLSCSAGSANSLKKSVSFNDRVDRTMFATNQSVSAMHAALRSKRRRARKHDAKQEQRLEKREGQRRRRFSSGSNSVDSGDDPAPITNTGTSPRPATTATTGLKGKITDVPSRVCTKISDDEELGVFTMDDVRSAENVVAKPEIKPPQPEIEPKQPEIKVVTKNNVEASVDRSNGFSSVASDTAIGTTKLNAAESASNVEIIKVKEDALESKCGDGCSEEGEGEGVCGSWEELDAGDGCNGGVESDVNTKGSGNEAIFIDKIKNVDATASTPKPFIEVDGTLGKNVELEVSVDIAAGAMGDVSGNAAGAKGVVSGKTDALDESNSAASKTVNATEAGTKSDARTEKATVNGDGPSTMLSWKDEPRKDGDNKKACAVEFTNSVIYDLDVE